MGGDGGRTLYSEGFTSGVRLMMIVILLTINRPRYLLSLRHVLISVTYIAMNANTQEGKVKDTVVTIGQVHLLRNWMLI